MKEFCICIMRTEVFVLTFLGIHGAENIRGNVIITKIQKDGLRRTRKHLQLQQIFFLFRYWNLVLECTDFTGGFEPGSVVWGCADQQGTEKKIPNGLIS
jgi:hypothetical protein